jgi:Polyketide cyclase / dehydrase and lipid transport
MIQTLDHHSVSVWMQAPAEVIYDIVADVTERPSSAPRSSNAPGSAAPPALVGAHFKARNEMPNRPTFSNKPVITDADRGRVFSFARTEPFGGTVEWTYRFEPDGDATGVTESYHVTKPVSRIGWFIIGGLFARKDRRADLS